MTPNTSAFRIERSMNRWEIVDPSTNQSVAHASTWECAVKAAKEIERSQMTPVADAIQATRTFRETLRIDHLKEVLAERIRRRQVAV